MQTLTRLDCNRLQDLLSNIDDSLKAEFGGFDDLQKKLYDLCGDDYNESNCQEIVLQSVK